MKHGAHTFRVLNDAGRFTVQYCDAGIRDAARALFLEPYRFCWNQSVALASCLSMIFSDLPSPAEAGS
jgi:hypothetical protein